MKVFNVVVFYGKDTIFENDQLIEINDCIQRAKLNIAPKIDPLVRLFDFVEYNLDKVEVCVSSICWPTFYHPLICMFIKDSEEDPKNRLRGILDRELEDEKTCGIEIEANGNVLLTIMKDKKLIEVDSHVGTIKKMNSEIFTTYKQLISLSFKCFKITELAQNDDKIFKGFKVGFH